MLVATTLVGVVPIVASLMLRAFGVFSSAWIAMALSLALSAAASSAGNAYWSKRGSGDVLFSELLLWGWAVRRRQEHQLSDATELLGLVGARPAHAGEQMDVRRHEQLLRQLAGALEGQDLYLNGHSHRVARHAAMIARGMGLPSEEVARVRVAAAVHDVGKLRTPKEILNKPGRLTNEEFDVIKRHSVDGAEMVAPLGDPALTAIVRHHHERLDGAGYPDHLAGDEIPLGARIVAVADTFDAVTSTRAYRGAARHREAIAILRHEAGTQLDPTAVRAFLSYYSGNRPALMWAMATAGMRRVVSWLAGDPAAAATISTGKLAAALAASAAIATSAAAMPVSQLSPTPALASSHAAQTQSARPAASKGMRAGAFTNTSATAPAMLIAQAAAASGLTRHGAVSILTDAPLTLLDANTGHHTSSTTRSPFGAGPQGSAASSSPAASTAQPLSSNPAGANNASSTSASANSRQPAGTSTKPATASHGRGSGAVNSHHGNPHSTAGQGNSNAGGRGKSNAGGQGHGSSNAGGQGKSNVGGQGQGSSNTAGQGQGKSNAGGQGKSNAGGQGQDSSNTAGQGQGNSNAGGQGKSNAGGQGQANSNTGSQGQGSSNAGGQDKSNTGG